MEPVSYPGGWVDFFISTAVYDGFAYNYATFKRKGFELRPDLLFIGGAFQDIRASYKICRALSKSFNVICVEVPGSGGADVLPESYDFGYIAELLYELALRLNLKNLNIIGCSYGSPVVYRFAQKFPNLVSKIVLTGVMREIPDGVRFEVERSVSLLESGRLEEFDALLSNLFFNSKKCHEIDKQKYLKEKFSIALSQMSIKTKIKYCQNTRRLLSSTLTSVPQINMPVLVVTGEYDNFTTPAYCKEFSLMCKNARFVLVDKSDHFFHVEQPHVTIELVCGFLMGRDIREIEGHSSSEVAKASL